MKARILALAALAPLCLAFAHDFGGNYDQARLCSTTSIEIEAGKVLSISSNAAHWNQGVFERVKAGTMKQFFGGNAWYRKVAVARVPADMKLGDQTLSAGEWTISTKVPGTDTAKYFLEWKKGDQSVDVAIDMKGGNDPEDHLLLVLTPRGDATSKEFELKVFHGDLKGTLRGSFAAAQ